MSGTGEIRSTPTSTGYLGASDAANVFLTNVPGTYFRIDGINTNGYANPQLSFGLFKNTTASDGSDLVVEVSGDGINFTALNFPPLPTGTSTTVWHYRIAEEQYLYHQSKYPIPAERFHYPVQDRRYQADHITNHFQPSIKRQQL
jgi:hypothetical protein